MVVFHFRILRAYPSPSSWRNCSRSFMIAEVRILPISGVIKRSNQGFLGGLTDGVNLKRLSKIMTCNWPIFLVRIQLFKWLISVVPLMKLFIGVEWVEKEKCGGKKYPRFAHLSLSSINDIVTPTGFIVTCARNRQPYCSTSYFAHWEKSFFLCQSMHNGHNCSQTMTKGTFRSKKKCHRLKRNSVIK